MTVLGARVWCFADLGPLFGSLFGGPRMAQRVRKKVGVHWGGHDCGS
jgi:hypothetical protein